MTDLMQFIQEVDLGSRVRGLLSLLDTADPCFLGLVVALFAFVGSKMVAGQPALQLWGLRLAAAVFLLYGGYAYSQEGVLDAQALPRVGVRSGIAGGSVLAVCWTVLPLVAFIYRYIRVALLAFLGYGVYAVATGQNTEPDLLGGIAPRALGVAGLAMIVAWILQPLWDFLKGLVRTKPIPETEVAPERSPEPAERKTVVAADPLMPTPYQPERDQTVRRRELVRMKVELFYVLVLPQVGGRFPRSMVDDFLTRYLGDHLPPDEVEENGRQFLGMLQQMRADALADSSSLEGLTRWYLGELRRLLGRDLAPEVRQGELWQLHQQCAERAGRLLLGIQADLGGLPVSSA